MYKLKKYIVLFLLIFLCSNKNYAQKIDSLLQELPKAKGINKSYIYFELAWLYKDTNYTKAILYGEEALKIAEHLKSQQDICIYNNLLGMIYLSKNRLEESQFYFFKALSIAEELNDKVKISQILNNLGSVYHKQLNHSKALEYFLESLKIKQELTQIIH